MCARYFKDEDYFDELSRITGKEIREQSRPDEGKVDVHPSEEGFILEKEKSDENEKGILCRPVKWGFPCYDKKGLIINARAENIEERKSFAKGIINNRCIIPASGFYEWDDSREKVTFTLRERPLILFGGIYDSFEGEDRFVIITCDANASMAPVHDRMPLIISEDKIDTWFSADFRDLLSAEMPELKADRKYHQMSLFDPQ